MSKTIIDTSFNLFLLSKYRTQLMGVAAMMIIICHAPQYGVEVSGVLRKMLVFLNIGVDIFLFLSGIGCHFSLKKSTGYFPWLKKRFLRILIPYTIVLLILRIMSLCVNHLSWEDWLLYFSTLRFWTQHDGMWYVALLVLLYPLVPLLYRAFEHPRRSSLIAFLFILLIVTITHIPLDNTGDMTSAVLYNLQWAFKRVVSFIIGMNLAPYVKQGYRVNAIYVIGACAIGCLLFHLFMKDVFYVWLYVLPILIVLCLFFKKVAETSTLNVAFIWFGGASLESYLSNIGIKALMPLYLENWIRYPIFHGHYLDYIFVIITGLSLAYISHRLSTKLSGKYLTNGI